MPAKRSPHSEEIRRMYLAGASRSDIARVLDVTLWTVRHHTSGMVRVNTYSDPAYLAEKGIALPFGQIEIMKDLTPEQTETLKALALKWQCPSLAEAALEILRDGLEELA